jgi:hypothetical protein
MPQERPPIAALLAALEEVSRGRPDRVLRLRGSLPAGGGGNGPEPFELLIFRGFSSSTTHPTAFDPDRPALPEEARIELAEVLQGPLDPARPRPLAQAADPRRFLDPSAWEGEGGEG